MVIGGRNVTTTGCRTVMVPKPSGAGKEWHEQAPPPPHALPAPCTPLPYSPATLSSPCLLPCTPARLSPETPRPTHASHPTHTPQMRFEAWPESTPAVPGVTVASVEEGSPAAAAGLVAGSIVYSINNIPVSARVVVVGRKAHTIYHLSTVSPSAAYRCTSTPVTSLSTGAGRGHGQGRPRYLDQPRAARDETLIA